MSEENSTPAATPAKSAKPAKPYPDFPLTAHPAGYWCKKIRGKIHYFGPWSDPDGALKKYLEQKDDLHAGRKPRLAADAVTVKDAANAFLNAKDALLETGELTQRSRDDYGEAAVLVVSHLGKGRLVADLDPQDFAALRARMAKKWGPHRLAKFIQCVRCLFKHAFEVGLIDRPLRFGPGFRRPTKKTFRLHRAEGGLKLFTPHEILTLLRGALVVGAGGPELVRAGAQLRAMILMGVNCGFGNADVGNLPLTALDLDRGWVNYPRPKTGVPRRCPLWPETVAAIREAMARRPRPKKEQHAALVFLTSRGGSWHTGTTDNPLSHEVWKLLKTLGIGRPGLNFYALRHTFRTVADEAKDQPAADFIMGHEVPHMSSVYRETISDERLKAVTDYVRKWLFAEPSPISSPLAERDPAPQPAG